MTYLGKAPLVSGALEPDSQTIDMSPRPGRVLDWSAMGVEIGSAF